MSSRSLHQRARTRRVNRVVYWLARGALEPLFKVFLRLEHQGAHHFPREGGVILVANHRSSLDPFAIGMLTRRPIHYMAKRELFARPLVARLLMALGAFPVDRGAGDAETLATARAILARGDAVLIFPEGGRIHASGLGAPRRGAGRLALETGVPIVPVAIVGTDGVRRGWRIRPRKVVVRAGRPLAFPRIEAPSPELAAAVVKRLWPLVRLQWEWLGGTPASSPVAAPVEVLAPHPATSPRDDDALVAVGGREPDATGDDPEASSRTGRFRRA